jgi:hypothetical protein
VRINLLTLSALSLATIFYICEAEAHIAYTDLIEIGTQTINADGSKTYTDVSIVKSNGAWADATDVSGGSTHATPWYNIDITSPQGAYVDLTLTRVEEFNGFDIVKDFTPAFSIFEALAPPSSHQGSWFAFADTTLSNPLGQVGTIKYLAHAGEVDGTSDTASLNNYFLKAGSYSLALGGSCYECYPHIERLDPSSPQYDPDYANIFTDIENDAELLRAYNLSLTLRPVPVPGAIWLMGSALLGVFRLSSKRINSVKPALMM